ncbi:MAG: hypothetical protein Q4B40_06440, partial [Clostridia bacterium]|nr:hypothetical protein [Clostridia bacterium]
MKKAIYLVFVLTIVISCFVGCSDKTTAKKDSTVNAVTIKLDGDSATLDGADIEEFDYTWHCDPSVAHDEVEDAPAEYYTGTKPETDADAYID